VLLLDTDALSLIQRGTGSRFESLSKILDQADDEVFITVISLDEQLHGAFKEISSNDSRIRIRGYRRLHDLVDDYCGRPMIDYDEKAEAIFDKLKSLKGRPATKDLRIASIAISHDATLVNGNTRDFEKVPHLKIKMIPS
jgi:tRNA(fMet)-specific endonuclease VapC